MTIVLTRSLDTQAKFEPTYFLHAISQGFAPRLHVLAEGMATLSGSGRATALLARIGTDDRP